jgi:hypothetical protein
MLTKRQWLPFRFFPKRRLEPDFPLVFWFVGLWCYLKAFLYVCYLYMLGLEPPPYPSGAVFEIAYFAAALIPALVIAYALWNEKPRFVLVAILFFIIDTPVLIYHVGRMMEAGFLDSTLTKILEFGSLIFNVVSLGWLVGFRTSRRVQYARKE